MAPTKPRRDEISEYVNANRETYRNQYDRVIFCCENDASKHISRVRHFADSGTIEILALTTRSIAENQQNKLYKETERLGNERPIDLIRATHPIVLLDETTETDLPSSAPDRANSGNTPASLHPALQTPERRLEPDGIPGPLTPQAQ